MEALELTPAMAAAARDFDGWRALFEAKLTVKRFQRPARRAAALKGLALKRMREERA